MLVIRGGRVWTGLAGQSAEVSTIYIDQHLIARVEPGASQCLSPSDTVVEAEGLTVIPGLINCHTHLIMDGSPDPVTRLLREGSYLTAYAAADRAQATLRAGVTTVRDLGSLPGLDTALRQAIADRLVEGPRLLVSGQCICMTGGHGHFMGIEVDGGDEARKAARTLLKQGVDVIKVMATGGVMTPGVEPGSPQLTEEELRAAIEEAHKAGRRTATHAQGTAGVMNALRAGVDSVEHGIYLDEACVDYMAEHGVYFVPTLVAPYYIVSHGVAAGIPEFAVRKAEQTYEAHLASFDLARRRGVRIAAGTDAGTPMNPHGSMVIELELMVKAGLSPEEALHSATTVAAGCLGLEKEIGTIETGKVADLVLVEGDPLVDIGALRQVRRVVARGSLVT